MRSFVMPAEVSRRRNIWTSNGVPTAGTPFRVISTTLRPRWLVCQSI